MGSFKNWSCAILQLNDENYLDENYDLRKNQHIEQHLYSLHAAKASVPKTTFMNDIYSKKRQTFSITI